MNLLVLARCLWTLWIVSDYSDGNNVQDLQIVTRLA